MTGSMYFLSSTHTVIVTLRLSGTTRVLYSLSLGARSLIVVVLGSSVLVPGYPCAPSRQVESQAVALNVVGARVLEGEVGERATRRAVEAGRQALGWGGGVDVVHVVSTHGALSVLHHPHSQLRLRTFWHTVSR